MDEGPKEGMERRARLLGRGRDERTPLYLHNAVLVTVAAFVAVVVAVVLIVWYAAG